MESERVIRCLFSSCLSETLKVIMSKLHYCKLIAPENVERLGCWEGQTNQYNEVFGYSVMGHFFLRSSESNEYSVLYPYDQAVKQYGKFKSIDEFNSSVLEDKDFIKYVIKPKHVEEVIKFAGQLNNEEVYFPCPYPMIGGSCEPNTYSKGNVWVFIELVGMTHGL